LSHYPPPIPFGPQQPPPSQPPPPSHLAWAIASAVLCCLPLSVVSIVYASRVDRLWLLGQYEEAARGRRLARNRATTSVAAVFVPVVVILIIGLVEAALEGGAGSG
jgi:hypothetical protein